MSPGKLRASRAGQRSPRLARGTHPLSIYLFQVAAQKADWLSVRQTAVAGNVANANTPGYRAIDIQPFSAVLDATPVALSATDPTHLSLPEAGGGTFREIDSDPAEATLSGNTVNMEQEMVKLGDVTRDFTMTANVERAFHQLMLAALK